MRQPRWASPSRRCSITIPIARISRADQATDEDRPEAARATSASTPCCCPTRVPGCAASPRSCRPRASIRRRSKLLGTMLWEDSRPGSEPALAGAWYAAPPQACHGDFDNRYAKAFGAKPPRLASLAYDATALAAVLARRSPRDFSAAMLTNPPASPASTASSACARRHQRTRLRHPRSGQQRRR